MSNNEKVLRYWLAYSKSKDKLYCFYCRLFPSTLSTCFNPRLGIEGFSDCKHVGKRLKEHEISQHHNVAQKKWLNLQKRLEYNTTIDANFQKKINSEKER